MPGSSVVDIRNTFGAAFIGLLVSSILFGLTLVQTWMYFWKYWNRDPKSLKFFIAFVTVVDTLHTSLCAYTIYWYLVLNFGNLENLQYTMWSMNIQVVTGTVISGAVQFYYARRVYILSRNIICPIVIVALSAVCSAFGILFAAKQSVLKQFSLFHTMTWILCVGLTAGALADLLIAVAMCWSLYRRRTGFARTDTIIMSLMSYSINSGLLVSLLAGALTITFATSPSSMITEALYWTMSKCYVNSLLAMLNSRDYIRRDRSTTNTGNQENAINLSSIRVEPSSDAYDSKSGQAGGVSVTVHRSISTRLDLGRSKSDHDVKPTFGVPKSNASVTVFQSEDQTSESNA